jgi:hypothetical protein
MVRLILLLLHPKSPQMPELIKHATVVMVYMTKPSHLLEPIAHQIRRDTMKENLESFFRHVLIF